MKTIYTLFTFIMFVSIIVAKPNKNNKNSNNSITTPQQLLISKSWNIQGKSKEIFFKYTTDEEILYVDGQEFQKSKYYISDTNYFNVSFNSSNIGKTNSGRFLVTEKACYYLTVVNNSVIQMSYLSEDNPQTTTLIANN